MSLNFADVPAGGGGWIKPEEVKGAAAILIEVKAYDQQRPTPNGPKDSALCDVTVFQTDAELAAGKPTSISIDQRIEQTVLARDLSGLVGSATIVSIGQSIPKTVGKRPAWIYTTVTAEAKAKVIEYANSREAARKAALDSAPDFD